MHKMAIDWSMLTDPMQALNLAFKVDAVIEEQRDVYQKNNIFEAKALTPGFGLSSKEAASMSAAAAVVADGEGDDPPDYVGKACFIGRIMGENSPHSLYPDPCKMTKHQEKEVLQAIRYHTLFVVSEAVGAAALGIEIDDVFEIILGPGDDNQPFNLQIGKALRKSTKASQRLRKHAEDPCELLKDIFERDGGYRYSEHRQVPGVGVKTVKSNCLEDIPDIPALPGGNIGTEIGYSSQQYALIMPVAGVETISGTGHRPHGYGHHWGFDMKNPSVFTNTANNDAQQTWAQIWSNPWDPHTGTGANDPPAYERWNAYVTTETGNKETQIVALAAGTVKGVTNVTRGAPRAHGLGNSITIEIVDSKSPYFGCEYKYAHMANKTPAGVGSNIAAGQVVGNVGQTGAGSGPHLHLEMKCPTNMANLSTDQLTAFDRYNPQLKQDNIYNLDDLIERLVLTKPLDEMKKCR